MQEVFEYTPTDINRLIRDDLVKRGKIKVDESFTISSTFNFSFGKFTNIIVKIEPYEVGVKAGSEHL